MSTLQQNDSAKISSSSSGADGRTLEHAQLWTSQTLATTRDSIVLFALLGYLIGFVHHSSLLNMFNAETDLIDQPLTDLLQWALVPLHHWLLLITLFVAIAASVAATLFTKAWPDRLRANIVSCAAVCAGIGAMLLVTYCLALWPDYESMCTPYPAIGARIVLAPGVPMPGGMSVAHAGAPGVLVGKTSDAYQVLFPRGHGRRCGGRVVVFERSEVPWMLYAGRDRGSDERAQQGDSPVPAPALANDPAALPASAPAPNLPTSEQ